MTVDTTLSEQDEADLLSIYGVSVSDVQSNISAEYPTITGTSKYMSSVNTFDMSKGHHFLILHISTEDEVDRLTVEVDPTQGSGEVELDESGVVILQLKDDKSQTINITAYKGEYGWGDCYELEDLTFEADPSHIDISSFASETKGATEFSVSPSAASDTNYYGYVDGDITSELVVGETAPETGELDLEAIWFPVDFSDLVESEMTVIEIDLENKVVRFGTFALEDIEYNTEKYTETELNDMTKQEILDLAESLLYTMTTTMANTKDEIIADFLTQQG